MKTKLIKLSIPVALGCASGIGSVLMLHFEPGATASPVATMMYLPLLLACGYVESLGSESLKRRCFHASVIMISALLLLLIALV